MRIDGKKTWLLAAGLVALLAVGGLSRPGRSVVRGFVSLLSKEIARTTTAPQTAATQQAQDVEQRARAAHAWSPGITNSIARGAIIYYDATGRATGQYAITIFRGYPDRVRIEIDRGQTKDVFGFDQNSAWKSGVAKLKDTDARDIRSFARICPERLFVTRAAGAAYSEPGQRSEDPPAIGTIPDWTTMPVSGSPGGIQPAQFTFDQVEVLDSLGPPPTRTNAGDIRRVYYYVDSTSSMLSTARWLEPDDPRASIDDDTASFTDIRVDFEGWRDVAGVKWPFKVTHSTGGRVDFRLVLYEATLNQQMPDTLFQRP